MVQQKKITTALLKGLRWLWLFVLISITIFGVALTLTTLDRWPQTLIGLLIAASPLIIWNIEKILTFACQVLRYTLRFILKFIYRTITLIHQRKWTALLFWGCFFWWDRKWVFFTLILLLLFKYSHLISWSTRPHTDDELYIGESRWIYKLMGLEDEI